MKLVAVIAGTAGLAVLGHVVMTASASSMSVNSPAGVVQKQSAALTVTNTVTDAFTVTSATPLNGQTTNFNSGAGAVTDAGPAWIASADWTNPAADYTTRASGTGSSMALIPWLTRRSSIQSALSTYNTSTQAGLVLGANAAGTDGVAAVLYYSSGSYRFGLFTISGGTASACSAALAVTGTAARTASITYSPAAGGSASATISGGGGGTVTCTPGSFPGSYAGLYSGIGNPVRYDNVSAVL